MSFSIKGAALALDLSKGAVKLYMAGKRKKDGEYQDVQVPVIVLLACSAVESKLPPIK